MGKTFCFAYLVFLTRILWEPLSGIATTFDEPIGAEETSIKLGWVNSITQFVTSLPPESVSSVSAAYSQPHETLLVDVNFKMTGQNDFIVTVEFFVSPVLIVEENYSIPNGVTASVNLNLLYELPESPDYPSEVTGEAEIFLDLPAGSQLLDSKSFVFSET